MQALRVVVTQRQQLRGRVAVGRHTVLLSLDFGVFYIPFWSHEWFGNDPEPYGFVLLLDEPISSHMGPFPTKFHDFSGPGPGQAPGHGPGHGPRPWPETIFLYALKTSGA